jgi:ribosomal protein S18 acetylase RimI-like enzyme
MSAERWETRHVGRGAIDRVAAVLARAFADDPMWRWTLGVDDTEEQRARLERFFGTVAGKVHAREELIFTAGSDGGDVAGAAVWMPPGRWRFSLVDEARVAPGVLGAFGAAGTIRLLKLLAGVERVHLRQPHYYLFCIGTDPAHQGRGVGAALLSPMLRRCDDEKLPVYLESSSPTNVPFYRRHGFVETDELRFGDGVVVTPMRRDPR